LENNWQNKNEGRAVIYGKTYGKLSVVYDTGKQKTNAELVSEKRRKGYHALNPVKVIDALENGL